MTTKAAGYIRVSSKEQTEGESLSTQRQSIKNYCKANGYKLTKIYADEGISGGTVAERHALLQCMEDGRNGKFETLIIHRLSSRAYSRPHQKREKAGQVGRDSGV